MDGKRPVVVWLTEEEIQARANATCHHAPDEHCHACYDELKEPCRAALDGKGARVWWACFDPTNRALTPFLFRGESSAREMHEYRPEVYGPPVQVVVVEVKK